MEHYRPNGQLEQGYFCSCCGMPCNMYGSGHRDTDFNPTCTPNPTLVQQLSRANAANHPTFIIPAVINEIAVDF